MGDFLKGEPKPWSVEEQTDKLARSFEGGYPRIAETLRGQIAPTERALFDVRRELSPQEQELNAQLFEIFAPRYTEAELANLRGSGGALVRESDALGQELDRERDPEFYRTRELTSNRLAELLTGGLSGGEVSAIERGLAHSSVGRGLDNVPTNTEMFKAAAEYGGGARDRLGQALALATQALPQLRTTSSGGQVQQQARAPLSGINQNLANTDFGNQTFQSGNELLASTGETARQASQQRQDRKSWNDEATQAVGAVCCFIFLESYNGRLPWFVRKCRDDYYSKDARFARGYVRMASVLVPLMRRFKFIRNAVNDFMVKPITCYGGYICGVSGFEHGKFNWKIMKFWLKVWKFLGK